MTEQEHKAEELAILKQEHKQWLQQPQTKSLLLIINNHEQRIVALIADAAMKKDVTADQVRLLSAQLATVKTLNKVMSDTDTFIHNCERNNNTQTT